MAAADADFIDHCIELLGALGRPRARRMFGGHGLYVDEVFIALIAAGTLYLKADADARGRFEQAGCRPFEYTTRDGQRAAMGYWSAPDEALESSAAMLPWARLALASALRAAAARTPVGKHAQRAGRNSAGALRRTGAAPKAAATRKRGG